jgi:serine/threonine protein kinase
MRMARHPNVVRMLGMCAEDEEGDMCLLMEYCLLGDLRHYLMNRTKVQYCGSRLVN